MLLLQSLPTSQPSSSASKNLLLPFTTTAIPVLHHPCITPGSSCQELPIPLSLFSAFQLYSPYLLLSICSVLLCNLCCSCSPKPLQLSALLSSSASSILRKHSEKSHQAIRIEKTQKNPVPSWNIREIKRWLDCCSQVLPQEQNVMLCSPDESITGPRS